MWLSWLKMPIHAHFFDKRFLTRKVSQTELSLAWDHGY